MPTPPDVPLPRLPDFGLGRLLDVAKLVVVIWLLVKVLPDGEN